MCNWIILFLLFCNGGCGSFLNGGSNNGCGCGSNRNNGCGCGSNGVNGRSGYGRNGSDCGCGCGGNDDRNQNTPPPWVRSNYSNGDTCGCEEQ